MGQNGHAPPASIGGKKVGEPSRSKEWVDPCKKSKRYIGKYISQSLSTQKAKALPELGLLHFGRLDRNLAKSPRSMERRKIDPADRNSAGDLPAIAWLRPRLSLFFGMLA